MVGRRRRPEAVVVDGDPEIAEIAVVKLLSVGADDRRIRVRVVDVQHRHPTFWVVAVGLLRPVLIDVELHLAVGVVIPGLEGAVGVVLPDDAIQNVEDVAGRVPSIVDPSRGPMQSIKDLGDRDDSVTTALSAIVVGLRRARPRHAGEQPSDQAA